MKRPVFLLIAIVLLVGFSQEKADARPYAFTDLWKKLGYSSSYFGATEDEITSLSIYTDKENSFFTEINGYLRFFPKDYDWDGVGPERAKIEVANIDRLLKRTPDLPADIILYRGMTLGWRDNRPFEIDEEYTDKAYISTSTAPDIAQNFARINNGYYEDAKPQKDKRVALFMMYFQGKKPRGILVEKEREEEVILPHGTRFRIMAKRTRGEVDSYLVQICEKRGCSKTISHPDVEDYWR